MKKDIEFLKVENIAIAVTPAESEDEMTFFTTYIINLKDQPLQNVFIRSKGIGTIEEEKVETATLRYLIENVAAKSFVKVEDFEGDAIKLSNEYWISFKENGYLFDKKFIFVPESIIEDNFIDIPILEKRGVLIR